MDHQRLIIVIFSSLFLSNHYFHQAIAEDTIFAKGGTCLYKIGKQWHDCMEKQNERLTYERDNLEPVYTRAALTESVNRISCCAYYEFLDCIEYAANKYCSNEKHDMAAYSRQLGPAVPSEICYEQFPRQDIECSGRVQRYSSETSSSISYVSSSLLSLLICLERIWPDFQRCRDRQREHHQYGRFSSGFFFTSTDVYQPKYKVECCSYWELLECVHRAAKIYCMDDDVDLKKLDQALETFGLNVPLYICSEEYPKGSLRCKIRSWFIMTIVMELSGEIRTVLDVIEKNQDLYVQNLADAIAIPSVSSQKETRPETLNVVKHFKQLLESKGVECELHMIGDETFPDGTRLQLPPVLCGFIGNDINKKTLCVYGHLDVQPALLQDGWNTEPFKLVERDGKLYGRGASDDKGPVLAWINMIDAFRTCSIPLPINLKFIFEAMEESGSIGLHQLIYSLNETFLKDVDYFCISDNYWLGQSRPCLSYGLRGNAYFYLQIECAKKDLHSGVYGGVVHEAMTDLIHLMSKLTDERGNILIPGIFENVKPFTTDERIALQSIDFDEAAYRDEIGTSRLRFNDKVNILAHRWRFPCLSIHGIEGAFADPGSKTVIPHKVIGKFSIRLVPNQDPDDITVKVTEYLNEEFRKLNSPNKISVHRQKSSRPWIADTNSNNFIAGKLAIKNVYGIQPDMTREGGSIPVTLTLEEVTNKSVILLPIGSGDDGAHSQNEKINRKNYINGSKVFAAYIYFLSLL
ncbi:cytosolic non-specific dipeptidase-like protein [Euroglyphus maynei]|uniref:Cytosolic non-specific dipeptidase-like protein n=1 Tax=Euroglyphus maynei TaxID=6958 RepID=A0A1Y3B2S3_EURMA|nr:cytosolic non-specific dipeptidase-like protein [Euroglyphus maynei]